MRQIKFRAWDSENYEMITTDNMGEYFFALENDGAISVCTVPDNEWLVVEIMQYTGLKDENGVEIYEGDCFYDGKDVVYVVFDSNSAKFIATWDSKPDWDMPVNMDAYPKNSINIIGNIYENPELLNDQ